MGPLQLLVGPNASGKSTFLDVIRFLGQVVSDGLDAAIQSRTSNLKDLIWQGERDRFELAVELTIQGRLRALLQQPSYDTCRYEIAVGVDPNTAENIILSERVLLKMGRTAEPVQKSLFPDILPPPQTILTPARGRGIKSVVNKVQGGNDNFYDETGKGWDHAFKLGPRESALGNLPEDESKFPTSTWLKRVLSDGIESLVLNSSLMRRPSPPGQPTGLRPDGSNLPWAVETLREQDENLFNQWIAHIRIALPDIKTIQTTERRGDNIAIWRLSTRLGRRFPLGWFLTAPCVCWL
jgi:predicted ATPase